MHVRFAALVSLAQEHPDAIHKQEVPQTSRLFEAFGKKAIDSKSGVFERSRRAQDGGAGFRRHGHASVVFEIADAGGLLKCWKIDLSQRHRGGTGISVVWSCYYGKHELQIAHRSRHRT